MARFTSKRSKLLSTLQGVASCSVAFRLFAGWQAFLIAQEGSVNEGVTF